MHKHDLMVRTDSGYATPDLSVPWYAITCVTCGRTIGYADTRADAEYYIEEYYEYA